MATAIEKAMNHARVLVINPYTIIYNSLSGCFEVSNLWVGAFEVCYIHSNKSLDNFISATFWGADPNNLMGAFASMGMVTGGTAFGGHTIGENPIVLNHPPDLQSRHQLFIKGVWVCLENMCRARGIKCNIY